MTRTLAAGFVLGVLCPSPLVAQGHAATVTPAPNGSALQALADEMAQVTVATCRQAPRGAVGVRTDADWPRESRRPHPLARALIAPTLQALSGDPRFARAERIAFAATAPPVYADRLGYRTLVDVRFRVVAGFLIASARVHASRSARASSPRELGGFELRVAVDAEIQRHLARPTPVSRATVVARATRLPSRDYLDLAVHDLDRDGSPELVLLTTSGVEVLQPAPARVGMQLRTLATSRFPEQGLVPAAARRRRSIGALTRSGAGLVARTSDHANSLAISWQANSLSLRGQSNPCPDNGFALASTLPHGRACAYLVPGRDFFDNSLRWTRGGSAPSPPGEAQTFDSAAHFYRFAYREVRVNASSSVAYEALITTGGRLVVRVGGRSVGAPGYGTALALADLEADATMEILTSHGGTAGNGEQLSLLRASPDGSLQVVWRSPQREIRGPVWVAASGDLDADGRPELLAIEDATRGRRARLWVVR